jgi:hypothetical protein
MICAHTVRRLKPGTFEQFKEAFGPGEGDEAPRGLVRFFMLRGTRDENLVATFGFFEGTADDLEATQAEGGRYQEMLDDVAPYVDEVVSNDVYDVVVDRAAEGTTA